MYLFIIFFVAALGFCSSNLIIRLICFLPVLYAIYQVIPFWMFLLVIIFGTISGLTKK